jgi:hypothetical protein
VTWTSAKHFLIRLHSLGRALPGALMPVSLPAMASLDLDRGVRNFHPRRHVLHHRSIFALPFGSTVKIGIRLAGRIGAASSRVPDRKGTDRQRWLRPELRITASAAQAKICRPAFGVNDAHGYSPVRQTAFRGVVATISMQPTHAA